MKRLATIVLLGAATSAMSGAARAAEYCVSCSGPSASYRCSNDSGVEDSRAWLMCITELARENGHESCSVDRKLAAPCPGVLKVLKAPDGPRPALQAPVQMAVPAAPSPAGLPPPAPVTAEDGSPVEAAPKRPPQTVKEMADQTLEASKKGLASAGETVTDTAKQAGDAVTGTAKAAGDGLNKAGSAVGDAAKKTWTCVTSLFQTC